MPLLTPISVVLGVIFSYYLESFIYLVPWIFAFITFSGSLNSNFTSLAQVAANPFPIVVVLLLLHIIMPIWAWMVGFLVFPGDAYTVTGLVLGVVIPTGVTSLLWISIYKGNSMLALTIVLIDTLLSPIIVPYSVAFFSGAHVEMDTITLMKGLLLMVVLPSVVAMLLNQTTKGKIQPALGPKLAPFAKIALGLCVMLNSSKVAPYLSSINAKLIILAFMVLIIAATGYALAWIIGALLKWSKEDVITATYTGGMRNISAGATLAVTYFPAAVAVPVILAMLFQQVLASTFGSLLNRYYNYKPKKEEIA